MEKHANLLCYIVKTRFTKFRVSNLHITSTPDAVNTWHRRILPREAIPSHVFDLEVSPETWPGKYMGKSTPCTQPLPPNVAKSRAKPQQTQSVEIHQGWFTVLYSQHLLISQSFEILIFTPHAVNMLHQRILPREAIPSHYVILCFYIYKMSPTKFGFVPEVETHYCTDHMITTHWAPSVTGEEKFFLPLRGSNQVLPHHAVL